MILLAHMVFGAGVGYQILHLTNNVWMAGFLALLSHYFLDMFPHVEYLKSAETSIKKLTGNNLVSALPDAMMVFFDFFLGLLVTFLAGTSWLAIYFFAALAVVPDGLTVVHTLFPSKLLLKHHYIHGKLQYFTKIKKPSLFWRVFTQAVAVTLGIILLAL